MALGSLPRHYSRFCAKRKWMLSAALRWARTPLSPLLLYPADYEGRVFPGYIVRKEAKAHGTGQSIEGPLRPGSRVAIVDDVCTTGGSLFQAIEAAEAAGCSVVTVVTVLDRKEGGSEELRRLGYDFLALLEANLEGSIEVAVSVQS